MTIYRQEAGLVNRVLIGVGSLAIAALGVVTLTAGSVGAVTPRKLGSDDVTVRFELRGDLTSIQGQLHDFNCVERVQPNPFQLSGFAGVRVEVQSFNSPACVKNEAIWLLTTQPKSPSDRPETMGVRLRYGARPTTVEFLHVSKDLRWVSHVLSPSQVVVEITGK
jgi:hypothetical protein